MFILPDRAVINHNQYSHFGTGKEYRRSAGCCTFVTKPHRTTWSQIHLSRVILPQYSRSVPIPVNRTFHMFVNQETFVCKFVTQSSPASTYTFLSLTNLQVGRSTSSPPLSHITPWKSSTSATRPRLLHGNHPFLRLVSDRSMSIILATVVSYRRSPWGSSFVSY